MKRYLLGILKYLFQRGVSLLTIVSADSRISKKSRTYRFSKILSSSVGDFSYVGPNTWLVSTEVGKFCSIAPNCKIGLAEELGTGMRKISKYIREYAKHGGIEFFDEDLFRARLPIPPEEDSESVGKDAKSVEKDVEKNTKSVEKGVERIFAALKENPNATQEQLASLTGLTRRGVEKNLQQLKAGGRIIRRGGRRYGFWEITNQNA